MVISNQRPYIYISCEQKREESLSLQHHDEDSEGPYKMKIICM